MKIREVNLENDILIVAEIGNNHEGDSALAKEMIRQAASAGAGAVKFQTIVPDALVARSETARYEQLKKVQLTRDQFRSLKKCADREGVLFLSTPFDIESAIFLNDLVPAYKVASGDNNFFPMIDVIARTGKPILLSTGLADMQQLSKTKRRIEVVWDEIGCSDRPLALLHCVCSYPTPPDQANLSAIRHLRSLAPIVGYSDHTQGIEAAVLSVALGARIIEKHFTLDKRQSTHRDHQLSADPAEMKQLVQKVREAQRMLGDGIKRAVPCERENLRAARRSIVVARDLKKDTILTRDDLTWVRPGGGLAPGQEDRLVGKALRVSKRYGELISFDDVT